MTYAPRRRPDALRTGLSRFPRAGRLHPATLLLLGGCDTPASPAVPLFGAYFPSWLICAGIGVVAALLGRVLLIRLGIDDGLPLRVLVYICLALLVAFAAAVMLYGR